MVQLLIAKLIYLQQLKNISNKEARFHDFKGNRAFIVLTEII